MTYEEGYDRAKLNNQDIDYLDLISKGFTPYEALDYLDKLNKYKN